MGGPLVGTLILWSRGEGLRQRRRDYEKEDAYRVEMSEGDACCRGEQ